MIKRASVILFIFGLALPFNNCGYTETALSSLEQTASSQSMQMMVGISGPSTVKIAADTQVFNVQGICNPGSYTENEISWSILSGNNVILNSQQAGDTFFSSCLDGQFQIDVAVPCPGVTNSGNNCFGLTKSYSLRVHILGLDAGGIPSGDQVTSNQVTLSP